LPPVQLPPDGPARGQAVVEPTLEPALLRRPIETDEVQLILIESLTRDGMKRASDLAVGPAEAKTIALIVLVEIMFPQEREQFRVVHSQPEIAPGRHQGTRYRTNQRRDGPRIPDGPQGESERTKRAVGRGAIQLLNQCGDGRLPDLREPAC